MGFKSKNDMDHAAKFQNPKLFSQKKSIIKVGWDSFI